MATKKQIESNKKNALLSTGAVTEEGKAIVAKNAVKHGIFTKDLIISDGDGRENGVDYKEIFQNLIQCLNPNGQMEYLLTEKIAVDFWRLKRVLRYETGCIRQYIDEAIREYYSETDWRGNKKIKSQIELDAEIEQLKENIDWNNKYMKCLKKGVVKFDNPSWEGYGLESDIEEDLYILADLVKDKLFDESQLIRYEKGEFDFEELRVFLQQSGYSDKTIRMKLVEHYSNQNEEYKAEISDLEQEKRSNELGEDVQLRLKIMPRIDQTEKVIRYEKAIQKSIFQNLAILKKLQSLA